MDNNKFKRGDIVRLLPNNTKQVDDKTEVYVGMITQLVRQHTHKARYWVLDLEPPPGYNGICCHERHMVKINDPDWDDIEQTTGWKRKELMHDCESS